MADDGNQSFPISNDPLAAAEDFTPFTPFDDVYALLRHAHADIVPQLIETIAMRTCSDPEALAGAWRYLRNRSGHVASTPGEALAFDLLGRAYHDGLTLRRLPDGALQSFTRTHWCPVDTNELGAALADLALNNPGRYAPAQASVREALHILKYVASPAEPPDRASPRSIVNTRTGELWISASGNFEVRSHRPESQMCHVLQVDYEPTADCPRFDAMLQAVFATANEPAAMIAYLLELWGYALQPLRDLPTILVFWGAGQNGKSKLLEILSTIVGADQIWAGSLANLTVDRFVMPNLAGKLLFVEDDAKDGVRLDDGLLKKLSENKPVDTRRARASRSVSFVSTLMPIIATNGTPHIEDTSQGLRRRLQIVPFTRRFTDSEADTTIATQIIADELPGVLNRCLAGLHRLRQRGYFAPPGDCLEALDHFLAAANPLNAFLSERVTQQDGSLVRLSDFWDAFCSWCRAQGHSAPFAQRQLKARLEAAGYGVHKSSVMVVANILLRGANESDWRGAG